MLKTSVKRVTHSTRSTHSTTVNECISHRYSVYCVDEISIARLQIATEFSSFDFDCTRKNIIFIGESSVLFLFKIKMFQLGEQSSTQLLINWKQLT
jgi:hypothetical protein